MALSDIILGDKEVLITSSDSVLGLLPINNKLAFGTVQLVSDMCDKFTAGNPISYNPSDVRNFMYGSTIYIIVKEENIFGTEVTPP